MEEVKRRFLQRRCVQSSFTAADEKPALALHHRGVSLLHVERAILLGALRKYASVRQNGLGTPISSLHYFANLFEEVQQEIPTQYWTYVAHKVNTFEQTELWAIPGDFGKVKCDRRETKPGMLWVDRVGDRRSRAILARYLSEKNGEQTQKQENEQERRTGFTPGKLRDETMTKTETKQC